MEISTLLLAFGMGLMLSCFLLTFLRLRSAIIFSIMIAVFVVSMAGVIMLPPGEDFTFCEEEMNGMYEFNDGLKTCTLIENGEYVTYKLLLNEYEKPVLSKFASQEKTEVTNEIINQQ